VRADGSVAGKPVDASRREEKRPDGKVRPERKPAPAESGRTEARPASRATRTRTEHRSGSRSCCPRRDRFAPRDRADDRRPPDRDRRGPIDTPATILTSLKGVSVDGKPVRAAAETRLFLFHKPSGVLTAERDFSGRPTIYDRLPKDLPRLMPVGRLDLNTKVCCS
jgi:23S rRNA pseudouridine2605 synthase